MIKSELTSLLAAEKQHLQRSDVKRAVAIILETISQALEDGRRVELRGFGAFHVRDRQPRSGRNPRTGEAVAIEEKAAVVFKAGKEPRARLNATADDASGRLRFRP